MRTIVRGPAFGFSGFGLKPAGLSKVCGYIFWAIRPAGLEPATFGLGNRRSILLSYGRIKRPKTTFRANQDNLHCRLSYCKTIRYKMRYC